MIYLDASVALAHLLAEDRAPRKELWSKELAASRLLEYEIWTRLHARRLASSHGVAARDLLGRVAMLEIVAPVVARSLEPFPTPVRTLDALHLASLLFLREYRLDVRLATYDGRMRAAAEGLGLPLWELDQ